MIKKILITVLCLLICFSLAVNAELTITITDDQNAVKVKGTSDKDDLLITMLKSGSTMEELYSALNTEGGKPEDFLLYYKQLETENSEYSDTIMMPESVGKGEYLVTVGDEQQTVSYSPLSFRLSLIPQFANAKSGDDVEKIITENKNYIGFSKLYDNLKNKPLVADIVYERIGDFTLVENDLNSWKSILALINNAILVSALNDGMIGSFATVKEMIYADEEIEDMYSLADATTEEGVALVIKNCSGCGFDSYKELKTTLTAQLALQAFNWPSTVNSDNLIGILESYGDILGLSLTSFNSLSYAKKAACVSKLSDKKCSLGEMNTQLQTIVSSLNSTQSGGASQKSSHSSGTSGSVGMKVATSTDTNAGMENNTAEEFTDMSNFEWAKEAVNFLRKKEIISGYDESTFAPANHVTRCEFVVLAVKAMYQTSDTDETVFSDVGNDYWGYKYIMTAYKQGIIKGTGDRKFFPDNEITREDIAVILGNILNVSSKTYSAEAFSDDTDISDYARDAVYCLKSAGIVNGNSDGTFMPKSAATRAEAAQLIYNFLAKKNSGNIVSAADSSADSAGNGTETEIKDEDEYNFLVALGVADDTFDYNYSGEVKKDGFTQMVANAAAFPGNYEACGTVYADVPLTNEYAAAIEMLAKKNGADPDGTTYFYPHSNLTLEQAIKIIFDATDYSYFANAMGDGGYLAIASKKKMLKNISCAWNAEINGNDALMLIRNMLELNTVHFIAENTFEEDTDETLLEQLHHVYDFSGVICANSLTTFYAESDLPKNSILLETDGKYIEMDCGATKAADSFGIYATVYYRQEFDGDTPTILYFETNKNTVLNLNLDNIADLSENTLSYYENDIQKDISFSDGRVFIYNDTYYSGDTLTEESLEGKVGNLIAVDNNSDGRYDFIKITAYDTYVVNNVLLSDEIIYDKYNSAIAVDINKENYESYLLKFADGSDAELADIRDGVVVSVAQNSDQCSVRAIKIIISDKKISGTVTEFNKDSNAYVTLDYNSKYKVLKNAEASFSGVGTGILAYLDAFSNIAYISNTNTGGFYYGLVLETAKSQNVSNAVQIKIYSQDNKIHIYTFGDSVTIDGSRYKGDDDIYTKLSGIKKLTINGNEMPDGVFPVRYLVNTNDEITKIDTAEKDSAESDDSFTLISSGKYNYTSDDCLGYAIPLTSSISVLKLVLPSSYTIDDITDENNLNFTTSFSSFKKSSAYTVAAYKNDSQSLYSDFIIVLGRYSFNYADPFLTISDIYDAYDEVSGSVVPCVKGIKEGTEVSVIVSDQFADNFKKRNLQCGDVIRYVTDSYKHMVAIDGTPAIVKYDLSTKKVTLNNIDEGYTDLASLRYSDRSAHLFYGYVKFRQEGLLQIVYDTYGKGDPESIRRDDIKWETGDIIYAHIGASIPVTVYDSSNEKGKQVYAGTYDDIKDYMHNGGKYSRILLKYRSSELKEVIVLNDASLAE